jgi:hypothetical protein
LKAVRAGQPFKAVGVAPFMPDSAWAGQLATTLFESQASVAGRRQSITRYVSHLAEQLVNDAIVR